MQFFSNSLLKMKDVIVNIATKTRNEIFEPLRTFTNNYYSVSNNFIQSLKQEIEVLSSSSAELTKHRDAYYMYSEKFEKMNLYQNSLISKV